LGRSIGHTTTTVLVTLDSMVIGLIYNDVTPVQSFRLSYQAIYILVFNASYLGGHTRVTPRSSVRLSARVFINTAALRVNMIVGFSAGLTRNGVIPANAEHLLHDPLAVLILDKVLAKIKDLLG
jgi:hypothetical protein